MVPLYNGSARSRLVYSFAPWRLNLLQRLTEFYGLRELLGLRELVREIKFMVRESMTMRMESQVAIKQLESEESMMSANAETYE